MTQAEQLAEFVVQASYDDIPDNARQMLKYCVLDALGCAIGALDGEPIRIIRAQIEDFGGAERCTMIGGLQTSPDRAAFYTSCCRVRKPERQTISDRPCASLSSTMPFERCRSCTG